MLILMWKFSNMQRNLKKDVKTLPSKNCQLFFFFSSHTKNGFWIYQKRTLNI